MSDNEVYEIEKQTKADFIKCQACGSNMVFDPESQMLFCEHCETKVSIESSKQVSEIAIETAFSQTEVWSDTAVLTCSNCGASIAVSREEVALCCPYCGTSHIKKTEEICGVKPSALYPFLITKENAEVIAKNWARKKLFAPRKFKKDLVANNLRGIYQPCFTFDSQTFTFYDGRLGKRKTRTVKTKNGYKTQTYIEWYNVRGSISLAYDDITITASENIKQSTMQKLMPFKHDTICAYEKKYLAGFIANHYDKDVRKSWAEAKVVMEGDIKNAILRKHNCDVVGHLNTSTTHSNVTYKYVLLPIYHLNYHYKNKSYEVNVNGSTGRVLGKSPVSPLKVLIAIAVGAAAFFGLYYLFKGVDSSAVSSINGLITRLIR